MKTFVLDTNVVLEALRNPAGRAGDYLRGAREVEHRLAANIALALEYEAVCRENRQEAGLSAEDAQAFATGLLAMVNPVQTRRLWHPRLRDPVDELVLEAAVNGGADAIVSMTPKDFAVASVKLGIVVVGVGA
jgi:predicted nucleic acid-binding protein